MTPWTLPDGRSATQVFTFEDIQEAGYHGFVYLITNELTGQKYIGRKRMTQRLTRPPLKGRKNRRHYVKESNWRKYTGSCKQLNEDIKERGIQYFKFEILSFHCNQTELNYHEMAHQFLRNVLQARNENGDKMYYNDNIAQQFYSSEPWHEERMLLHESFTS
jgi:hypothetical protein